VLCFEGSKLVVKGCVDSNFESDINKRIFTLVGGSISWLSKLQVVVTLSNTEAEYVAATKSCKEVIWIQRLMEELKYKHQKLVVYWDKVPCRLQGILPFILGQST